jgi:hypothetical protein
LRGAGSGKIPPLCKADHAKFWEESMQKIIIAIMVLAFGLTVSQGAFARMKDNSNFGYCPDGTKVPDTTKCPKPKK